jgi:hypothetical protein
MNYRSDGTQINREILEGDPAPYVAWKKKAIAESIPFSDYVKELE